MGQYEYGLKSLADDQLLAGLARIVRRRNQITAEFLAHLAELDERQLFLDLGFPSLFEYCVKTLRLCESTAGRHIAAARVCRRHPQVFAWVASGALHASALSLLKKHLTPGNAEELFELCTHQSARKVEELLAARFPRSDVRDLVRRLPTRASVALDVGCSAEQATKAVSAHAMSVELMSPAFPSREPLTELAKANVEPLREPHAAGSGESSKQRRFEPLSADRYGVHFTADGEFCALLERVRGLAGHRLPSGDLLILLKRGLESYERELEKERFAVGCKARRGHSASPASATLCASSAPKPDLSTPDPSTRTTCPPVARPKQNPSRRRKRYYPAAVVRAVFLRDEKQCTYVSPGGRRCGARRCLELDHIEPLAVGGEATVENLRLRCRAHNQRYARQYFGSSRVNSAIQVSRRRRAALRSRDAGPSEAKRCAERLGEP